MRNFHLSLIVATCGISVYASYDLNTIDSLHRLPKNSNEFKPRMVLEGTIPIEHTLPFVAFIVVNHGKYNANCTGSIIAPKYVLTAYHCLLTNGTTPTSPDAATVRVGSQYKSKGRAYQVREYYITDKTSKSYKNWDDIVVLELTQEILFDFLTTAAITLGRSTPRIGDTLTIAGHGIRIVQRRRLAIDSYVIGNVTVRRNSKYCKPVTNEFCAGGLKQGSAKGDSGGPAFKIINRKYVQVALITGGQHFHIIDKSRRDYQLIGMYDHGTLLKIAPYCGYIQKATGGAAYCQ